MTNDPLTWENIFGAFPGYENMSSDYDAGYAAALRDAVEAIKAYMQDTGWDETTIACTVAAIEALGNVTPAVTMDADKADQ